LVSAFHSGARMKGLEQIKWNTGEKEVPVTIQGG
jgi:hypothetical protein